MHPSASFCNQLTGRSEVERGWEEQARVNKVSSGYSECTCSNESLPYFRPGFVSDFKISRILTISASRVSMISRISGKSLGTKVKLHFYSEQALSPPTYNMYLEGRMNRRAFFVFSPPLPPSTRAHHNGRPSEPAAHEAVRCLNIAVAFDVSGSVRYSEGSSKAGKTRKSYEKLW